MQDKYINEFIATLSTKLDTNTLKIVKTTLEVWSADYDIKEKETSLVLIGKDIYKEMKEFLVTKHIEGFSDCTLEVYHNYIHHFLSYLNKPIKDITKTDVIGYLYNKQKLSNIKDISVNSIRSCLSSFFGWLVDNEYITYNPVAHIKTIKCETKTRHALTSTEMELLRESCTNLRDKAIVEVLYSTGCRVSELVNLKISDVNFNSKEVHLFGKGKKHRTSYLNARASLALARYLESRDYESEYVFCSIKKPHNNLTPRAIQLLIKKLKTVNNIENKCTPHIIRHTMATDALKNGMPVEQIQQLLGHNDINTTLIYAESNKDEIKHSHGKYIV